jgi:hypothetical protein
VRILVAFRAIVLMSMVYLVKAKKELVLQADVITPSGTALGGAVDMTLRSNGTDSIDFHMHDSGIPNYDFMVRAIFTTPRGLVLVVQHSGHVEGTVSTTLTHAPNRDDDHHESGTNPELTHAW